MARGLPDYYNPDTLVSQRLANVEEIVTHIRRLASIDNRGRTLYFDHFEEGIAGWNLSKTGDGVNPVASISQALIAPASMYLNGGTDSGGGTSTAQKRINVRSIEKGGLEFSYRYHTTCAWLKAGFGYDNGTNWLHGSVYIDRSAKEVQVLDNITPVTIAALPTAQLGGEWLTIKMVIDFTNQVYDRLLVGLAQFDISAYALQSSASSDNGFLRAQFIADCIDDVGNNAYVGHIAITVDEP